MYDAAYQMYVGAGRANAVPPTNAPGATVGAEDATAAASAFAAIPPELAFPQFAQAGGIATSSDGLMYIATPNGFAAVPPPPNAAAPMRRMSRAVQVCLRACHVRALPIGRGLPCMCRRDLGTHHGAQAQVAVNSHPSAAGASPPNTF